MTATTVVLHGATGTQGRAIHRELLAAGHTVRALARRPPAVPADLLDLDALVAAYTGAGAVVVQLPIEFGPGAVRQADTVLAALSKAAVPRAVFSTGAAVPPPVPVGVPFIDARVRLAAGLPRAVPVASVIGPAGPYLENLAAPWSRRLVHDGELRYPLPATAPVPWAAAADLGAAIAGLVTAAAPPAARIVAGPAAPTGPELAADLSAAIGRPVRWQTITPEEYARMLTPHLGATAAEGIAAAYAHPAPPPDPALTVSGTTTARAWAAGQSWTD